MIEIGSRERSQPPPPHVVFEALVDPVRAGARPWLFLEADELSPVVLSAVPPETLTWASVWPRRRDVLVRFDLFGGPNGTRLRWTLMVNEPAPDERLIGHLRKRMNQLINRDLRLSFGH